MSSKPPEVGGSGLSGLAGSGFAPGVGGERRDVSLKPRPFNRYDPALAGAVDRSALKLGVAPTDLATAISYETGGTFHPWARGPRTDQGRHRGLIQWGEPQRKQYGVSKSSSVDEQMDAVTRYLSDRGVKPGDDLTRIYAAINGGRADKVNARDARQGGAPGTVAQKVAGIGVHRANAERLLNGGVEPTRVARAPIEVDGVRVKSPEAVAGGEHHPAVAAASRWLEENAPGGVKHFAALNDRFHHSHRPNSLHTRGLAADATFNDPGQYAAGKRALGEHFTAAGLDPREVQIIDHHARRDAPAHLHFGFKTAEAANKYQRFAEAGKPEKVAEAERPTARDPDRFARDTPAQVAAAPAARDPDRFARDGMKPAAKVAAPVSRETPAKVAERPTPPPRPQPAGTKEAPGPAKTAGSGIRTKTAAAPATASPSPAAPPSGVKPWDRAGASSPAPAGDGAPRMAIPFQRASFNEADVISTAGEANPLIRVHLALNQALETARLAETTARFGMSGSRASFIDT